MSTPPPYSSTALHLAPCPWKSQFQSHISKLASPAFVLSTLHPAPPSSHSPLPTPYLPRARFCIYRGMWAELPPNKHNSADPNPAIYTSEMPTFTTDVRMEKVSELFTTGPGHAEDASQMQGSGGGGPVEAVWWVEEVGLQWRIRGTGWVVRGEDMDQGGENDNSGVRTVKSEVGERMRVEKEERREEWSWGREVTGHFGNCSPRMRGSWRNPPPGTPITGAPDADHALGQSVTELDDAIARENFRVVVIKPDLVESVDLSDPTKAKRHRYTFLVEEGEKGEKVGRWSDEELWP